MKSKLVYAGLGFLNLLVLLAVLFGLQTLIRGRVPDLLGLTLMSLTLLVAYVAGVRWIERREPEELLHRAAGREFSYGLTLGICLFATVMLVLWTVGVYQPTGRGSIAPLAAGFLTAFLAAVSEEIIFRGFLFRLTQKLGGMWGALAVTSILFGAAHAANKGATVGSSVAIALEAGVLLGAAYALTQRLWLPIGLHLGWNFAEGSIFGMSVSGGTQKGSLITGELHGSNLLTGGAFGPEASIVAVIVCLMAAIYLLWKATHRPKAEVSRPYGFARGKGDIRFPSKL
ncbi:MAG TPA: CPBP family intramembrane glutamic endopeptidase [Candidatus Angelobacter sp.]|nr:CPBP family intramembrane glutamic endopeptidase [Candidatus Angelobacter sp.]